MSATTAINSSSASRDGNTSHVGFLVVATLLFAASAAITVVWCGSMSEMGGMEMPDGWTMSMAWMLMPGQTWLGASASFLGMWVVMMAAMMLPSLTPMLLRYRRSVGEFTSPTRLAWLTAVAGCGYFAVWTLVGAIAFPLGAALASLEMREPAVARAVPLAVGVVVLLAGGLQFTAWKARQLACCRGRAEEASKPRQTAPNSSCCGVPADSTRTVAIPQRLATRTSKPESSPNCRPQAVHSVSTVRSAWRHGLHLGVQCSYCCAGLTAILLAIGVMDLRAMGVVTAAITAERLAPGSERAASAVRLALGATIVGTGLFLIASALGLA